MIDQQMAEQSQHDAMLVDPGFKFTGHPDLSTTVSQVPNLLPVAWRAAVSSKVLRNMSILPKLLKGLLLINGIFAPPREKQNVSVIPLFRTRHHDLAGLKAV